MNAPLELIRAGLAHDVPEACWSTGPMTGTAADAVCPGCTALRELDRMAAATMSDDTQAMIALCEKEATQRREFVAMLASRDGWPGSKEEHQRGAALFDGIAMRLRASNQVTVPNDAQCDAVISELELNVQAIAARLQAYDDADGFRSAYETASKRIHFHAVGDLRALLTEVARLMVENQTLRAALHGAPQ